MRGDPADAVLQLPSGVALTANQYNMRGVQAHGEANQGTTPKDREVRTVVIWIWRGSFRNGLQAGGNCQCYQTGADAHCSAASQVSSTGVIGRTGGYQHFAKGSLVRIKGTPGKSGCRPLTGNQFIS